jgi:hypothetical protein
MARVEAMSAAISLSAKNIERSGSRDQQEEGRAI